MVGTLVMTFEHNFADDMEGVVLALGKLVLVGGLALAEVVEEGVSGHDVFRVVGASGSHSHSLTGIIL